jgi:hypothetical protein
MLPNNQYRISQRKSLIRIARYSYIVRDANNFAVAYVYFESEPGRRAAASLMTKDEARKIAAGIAKLPDLLGVEQRTETNPLVHRRST